MHLDATLGCSLYLFIVVMPVGFSFVISTPKHERLTAFQVNLRGLRLHGLVIDV